MPNKDDKSQLDTGLYSIEKQLTNEYILRKSEDYSSEKIGDPSFLRDILPFYKPLVLIVGGHVLYFYTGNMLLSAWVIYIATPFYNMIMLDDE